MITLSKQTFADLKGKGHGVPRYESTGAIIPMNVGKTYTVKGHGTTETLKVKVTQDCPTHLIVINN